MYPLEPDEYAVASFLSRCPSHTLYVSAQRLPNVPEQLHHLHSSSKDPAELARHAATLPFLLDIISTAS